jgi:helix-turn-helix protein
MPRIMSDEEVKRIIVHRIMSDSKNREIFKGCKLKEGKSPQYEVFEPEKDSFGHYTVCNVEGYVEVIRTSGDAWLISKPGKKAFSAIVSYSTGKIVKMVWQPCEKL